MYKSPLASIKGSRRVGGRSKSKASNKGTILRAVPLKPHSAESPLSPIERDMATLPNQEVLANIGRASPTSQPTFHAPSRSQYQASLNSSQSGSSNSKVTSAASGVTEKQYPELKGTIGIYKHGRIEWEYKDKSQGKGKRPQIQVIIPEDQLSRPLPTSPFFGHAPFSSNIDRYVTPTSSDDAGFAYDVSPPTASDDRVVHDSVVSPLNSAQHPQQQRRQDQYQCPHNLGQIQPLVLPQTHPEAAAAQPKPGNTPPLSNSSDESQEDDGSPAHSRRTSMSSIDALFPIQIQGNRFEYPASETLPVRSSSKVPVPTKSASDRSPQSPQRRYYAHPPIDKDAEFEPTCVLRPLRLSKQTPPQPIQSPKSSDCRNLQRNFTDIPKATETPRLPIRSCSAEQPPSPTLSEAAEDLAKHFGKHFTSCYEDNPFKWDEILSSSMKRGSPRIGSKNNSPMIGSKNNSPMIGSKTSTPRLDGKTNSPKPAVPRRSSRRASQISPGGHDFRLSKVPGDHIVSQLKKNRCSVAAKAKGLRISIPGTAQRVVDDVDFVLSPIPIPPRTIKRTITPAVAENVILTILRNLETLDDLFSTAIINRGFYRVFKRHELDLMKRTLRKMSPPAWEHREICYPGHDQLEDEEDDLEVLRRSREYTPTTYFQYYKRDVYIIAALKGLIKEKCQSFLRPEMAVALVSTDPVESARVDDAMWRIWTFCKLFGSGKGREEDIVAQMDWLKGGILVHQQTCTTSILTTDALDMNGALASAPECFAKGNEGGLTAEELFDMMELWNCLAVLFQPFEGRTLQAREFGLYDNMDIRGGDIDREEMILDEWYYYLLTLGLSTILDLAEPCSKSDASVFVHAQKNGWLNWNPPVFGGTRRSFLKEAASRVYEEMITVIYAESSTKEVQRQLSKQRIQNHISELQRRKNNGERLAPIRMSQERPISEWENVINNLTRPLPPPTAANLVTHIPLHRSPTSATSDQPMDGEISIPVPNLPATQPEPPRPRSPPRRIVAEPLLPSPPPSTVPSVAGDLDNRSSIAPSMPSIEEHPAYAHHSRSNSIPEMPSLSDHPAFRQQHSHQRTQTSDSVSTHSSSHTQPPEEHPAFQQHEMQHSILSSNLAENTAEKAVFRIVEMGFPAERARYALRVTDNGAGLRVDRAVELLLREG